MAPEDPSIISPTRPARTSRIFPDSPGIREEPRLRAMRAMRVMRAVRAPGAVTAAWVTVLVVSLAGAVLTGMAWDKMTSSDAVDNMGSFAGAIAYATLGALIVRRARNLIGWFSNKCACRRRSGNPNCRAARRSSHRSTRDEIRNGRAAVHASWAPTSTCRRPLITA